MNASRLRHFEQMRAELWKRHYEWDLKPWREGIIGIMGDIRAEKLDKLDRIIARLKNRLPSTAGGSDASSN